MKATYLKAKSYIMSNGSALQKVCCKFIDGTAMQGQVGDELAKYQNADGGFGKGIEIEYQGDVSSAMATVAALGHMARFGLKDSLIYKQTIAYLKEVQNEDGSFDESESFSQLPHPSYMDRGVYVEYKTGMVAKWLLTMKSEEKELIHKAIGYMESQFDEVSKREDIWSAISYLGVYAQLPPSPKQEEVIKWCTEVFRHQQDGSKWQKYSSCIDTGEAIAENEVKEALTVIKDNQREDGAWDQPYGEYYRVWLAIYMLQFIKEHFNIETE